jgi:TolB-like protein
VLAKAMARSPDDRYATPRDFAAALQESLGLTWPSDPRVAPDASFVRAPAARWIVGASLVAAAVLAVLVIWPQRPSPPKPIGAIAVLPFTSPASDSTPAYFVEGIHDELIGELGRVSDLRITSRHSVISVDATSKSMQDIARELDVDALVEGAVYRIADSVRLQIRLVRAEPEERQLWSRAYHTHQRDLTSLQESVARGIVEQIRTGRVDDNTAMQAGTPAAGRRPVDAPAYDAYLRGKYWLNKRTADGLRQADSAFRRAITLDGDFAAAHAGLATALALKVDWHYEPLDPIKVSRESIEAANRARALDPESAEAYAARGRVLSASHAPEDLVRRNFVKAIQLAPQYANAHGWYGMELSWRGKRTESHMANEQAIALEPLAPGRHMGYAFSAFNYGDFETALREARLALQLEPALAATVGLYEDLALLFLGRLEKCDVIGNARYPAVRGICLHETGRADEARNYIDSVAKRTNAAIAAGGPYSDILAADNLTIYYAWIGDVDAALHWETEAMRLTSATTASLLIRTPLFDRVRGDRRWVQGYDALSRRMWQQLNTPPLRLEP